MGTASRGRLGAFKDGRNDGRIDPTRRLSQDNERRPDWRERAPHRVAWLRSYVRMLDALLDYVEEGAAAGFWNLDVDQRATVEELRDRTDDLVDTLSWGADASDDLAALAEAEG